MTASITTSLPANVARTTGSHAQQGAHEFMVGQMINIKVQQKLDEQHYVAVMRGESRKVFSERQLPVGDTIDVVVVSVGEKLELRQVATDSSTTNAKANSQSQANPTNYADMRSVAQFYKCTFTAAELSALQAQVNSASDPEKMALAGVLLNKRGMQVQPALLDALCSLQSGTERLTDVASRIDMNAVGNSSTTVAGLAHAMRQMLQEQTIAQTSTNDPNSLADISADPADSLLSQVDIDIVGQEQTNSQSSDGDEQPQQHLFQLLNDTDTDGMGVRYGTLPILIDGRLVELELVMFQHRPREAMSEPLRRLVMSVHTSTLGTVQIAAEALNNRLIIKITGESLEHTESLAAYADDVSELVKGFGWALDSVGYEVSTRDGRLAQRVIEHSIRQGVIDNVW